MSLSLVKPLQKGSVECKPFELRELDYQNAALKQRIASAMERSRYPGPCDARLIMNDLNKVRCTTYRKRMEREAVETQRRKTINQHLLHMLERPDAVRVDCAWSRHHLRQIEDIRREHQKAREFEKLTVEKNIRRWDQRSKVPESLYALEKTERIWPHVVKQMYTVSRWPCSDWWCEYLEYVAGKTPRRRSPPRPQVCCQSVLENFEKKVRQQISRNLIPLAYKQQQLSHQQCSLQGQAMLPKQA